MIKYAILSFILSFGLLHQSFLFEGLQIPIKNNSHVLLKQVYNKAAHLCKQSDRCKNLAVVGYFESRGESDEGVVAVMQVVLNRTQHEKFPNTVKDVVRQKYQFSFVHDGSLKRGIKNTKQWERMNKLAYLLINGYISATIENSTHYLNPKTVKKMPRWSKEFKQVAIVGNHTFFRCTGYC